MAWSPKETIMSATLTATEKFSADVDCGAGKIAVVQVRASFGGTTDDTDIAIYSNLDPRTYSGTGISVGAVGSGYAIGDILTMVGGVFRTAATVRVTNVSSGQISGIELVEEGDYSETPADVIQTTGGTGTGGGINGDWEGDDWDGDPIDSATLTNQAAPLLKTFIVKDVPRFRVGATGGSTDTNGAIINVRTYDPRG